MAMAMTEAARKAGGFKCRFCGGGDASTFADLGTSPLVQSFLEAGRLHAMEPFYPLHARVCHACLLVQLDEFVAPAEIFSEYAYFSSFSDAWIAHAARYADRMRERLRLGTGSLVVEIASNDGYLLRHFAAAGVPVLGIEPAANVARAAVEAGVRTDVSFHSRANAARIVREHGRADLVIGNNVLAHVPDLNDFVAGLQLLMKPGAVLTMEFPHLQRLIEESQFDTIYHEHFSYFSFSTAARVFAAHGLALFDVEELPTHGGSIRIYGCHADDRTKPPSERVARMRAQERQLGLEDLATYRRFDERVKAMKRDILEFLIDLKRRGKTIVGYGAPGKGNTLLNYCGIRTDFLDYTVDRNPYKQGRFTPGTRIPIHPPERIRETRPDVVLILPWNWREEIVEQMAYIRKWGGRFAVPIPRPQILP
jgi:2-polyprenyl-3-methyl-5-hydroxy-6-metoxy-1,4-benzoquinol methylase